MASLSESVPWPAICQGDRGPGSERLSPCHGGTLGLGRTLPVSQCHRGCVGGTLGVLWGYPGGTLGVLWGYSGGILGAGSGPRPGLT